MKGNGEKGGGDLTTEDTEHTEGTRMLDLVLHLRLQRAFSEKTFGPGHRTAGILDHIRKELVEIEAEPFDLEEWVDVVLLALDGAWRAGHNPEAIAYMLADKLNRNMERDWPDWRTADPEKAIEHVRDEVEPRNTPNTRKAELNV